MMCATPLTLPDRVVACGHCIECLIQRSVDWAKRLEHETRYSKSGYFVTLTYDDENLPTVLDEETGELVSNLSKKDIQDFIKLVRYHEYKKQKDSRPWSAKVRYFLCGEYGPTTMRAHYHLILLNVSKDVINILNKIWTKGFVKVDDVTPKSIRYVTNYMLLKDVDCLEAQTKPFTTMSKKPIIGAAYIVENYTHHYETMDTEMKEPSKVKRTLPRSYRRKLWTPEELNEINKELCNKVDELKEEELKKAEELDPLDPIGKHKELKQEIAKQKRIKAFKKLKKRKL